MASKKKLRNQEFKTKKIVTVLRSSQRYKGVESTMDVNLDKNETLREMACIGNLDEMIKYIKSGADVNSQNKVNGWTCLHWAVKRSHASVIRSLLANGADPNIQSIKGETAYELSQSIDIVKEFHSCSNLDKQRFLNVIARLTANRGIGKDNQSISFVPNYLRNPVFPHWESEPQQSSNVEVNSVRAPASHEPLHSTTVNQNEQLINRMKDLTLKVRVCCKNEEDFIEVDANPTNSTLDELINLFCKELNIDNDKVSYVRKLPNTKLRNDNDLKRLQNLQELELILT